jgi:hypothetical protein
VAYTLKARRLRRCRAITKAGKPCKSWAIWGHPEGLCAAHAGVTGGERGRRPLNLIHHARYEPCRCAAYPYPHRPGGGDCRWPDPVKTPPNSARPCADCEPGAPSAAAQKRATTGG